MASPKPRNNHANSTLGSNESESNTSTDVAKLSALLSSLEETSISRPKEADNVNDLAALLKQLDAADSIARGVENRLDEVLVDLEELVKGLEATQTELTSQSGSSDIIPTKDNSGA